MPHSQTRYFIPRFVGENEVPELLARIESALKNHEAIRIRVNKRAGVTTFAFPWESDPDSFERWLAFTRDLSLIHENCIAMSYAPGDDLRRSKIDQTLESRGIYA